MSSDDSKQAISVEELADSVISDHPLVSLADCPWVLNLRVEERTSTVTIGYKSSFHRPGLGLCTEIGNWFGPKQITQ